jgi:branched-chain amino acid transport system substrate-binding protein
VALAVNAIAKQANKVLLVSGGGTSDLTGKDCSPNTVHWTYDTWGQANTVGTAVTKAGSDSWYLMTVDYSFGYALERDAADAIQKAGGKILGTVRHPLGTSDLSSFLLQAQASGAKVIGLGSAGADTMNAVKQAQEFGIVDGGQRLVAMLMVLNDIAGMGLDTAQGLFLAEAFYWDLNDQTRAWARRFAEANNGRYPNMVHAGVYAGILHYLKAVEQTTDAKDGAKVVEVMKAKPTDDILFGKGSIRKDGRKIHDMYLFQVKTPEESKAPYDFYKLVGTVPAENAFHPLESSACPLVK